VLGLQAKKMTLPGHFFGLSEVGQALLAAFLAGAFLAGAAFLAGSFFTAT
jgi:hypothetical protein